MLIIKASVKQSGINGVGLFADEKILNGTVTWKYDPKFDISFSQEEIEQLPTWQQELIKKYAFLSTSSNNFIFSIDDSRFTNHSSKNHNIDVTIGERDEDILSVANRDIEIGEEILVNYRQFDKSDKDSSLDYLNS